MSSHCASLSGKQSGLARGNWDLLWVRWSCQIYMAFSLKNIWPPFFTCSNCEAHLGLLFPNHMAPSFLMNAQHIAQGDYTSGQYIRWETQSGLVPKFLLGVHISMFSPFTYQSKVTTTNWVSVLHWLSWFDLHTLSSTDGITMWPRGWVLIKVLFIHLLFNSFFLNSSSNSGNTL